ncbi:hypothetical protein [Methylocaldum sp.]|uniref:hypothetical protein n=1 Tax=Methylocaldum sp. TaxID=1969727 RepID=UPI002D697646|nr:hypothetical protein [Methylocaldum sp.]HYE34486.1 hypothetical protein [Methylocaldum sp.]
MSEYQYYEFVTIDRPLTPAQMAELRTRSSRASITPASFVNEYHWGDLKGDPTDWMRRYFDAFVYVANWCSCRFALRVPHSVFTAGELAGFETESTLTIDESFDHWIIEWALHESENYDRFGSENGSGWMGRLVPLRDELLRGDGRALYLGWLAGVTAGEVDEASLEPEPPPGLSSLTGAQQALVEFLEIDPDLLAAAASTDSEATDAAVDSDREMDAWLAGVPVKEARLSLKQLLQGHSQQAERQLKARFLAWQRERAPRSAAFRERRSVAELWKLAEGAKEIRLQRVAEELAQLKAEQRRRREAYLATLAADFDRCWCGIDQKAERGIASSYEEATRALVDLAEAYTIHASRGEFDARLHGFMERHGKRGALVRRLKEAELWR